MDFDWLIIEFVMLPVFKGERERETEREREEEKAREKVASLKHT
jgi:hypothetical protein